ncbi:CidA/LrgA family protein [Sedimentibacter sp.]|uniref:CidA/LrgA family protein n=1 Tax=Sedimentibacter sp. TaxID=1960295 RepID=UPI0028AA9A51|nr:CidA/LrgA family protein [Sedimentibacter sp.]
MKYLKQAAIILVITFIGEIVYRFIPLPIPASIYGLLLMLICLQTKILKLEQVKETGNFLLDIMPIMFIPPAVGLIEVWGNIANIIIPIVFVALFTTVLVMVTTGKTADFIINRNRSEDK